jgi:hypothetical protein
MPGLFLVTTLASLPSVSGAQSLSVTRRGEVQREADAGEVLSIVFRVRVANGRELDLVPRVQLPAGWRLLMPEAPFRLGAGAEEVRLVSITIPALAAAGRYVARYVATVGGRESAADSVIVQIRERRSLVAIVERVPSFAIADSSYEVVFRIRNAGNVAARLTPRVRSRAGFGAHLAAESLDVAPGASGTVIVRVDTRRADRAPLVTGIPDNLELRLGATDSLATRPAAVAHVRVYPQSVSSDVPYHTLPTTLTIHGSPQASGAGIAELSAHGALIDGGHTKANLLVRHPFTIGRPSGAGGLTPSARAVNIPFTNQSDEYTLRLESVSWRLGLGDQNASVLPLTQGYARGFGVVASGQRGLFRAGLVTLRDRRDPAGGEEQSAMVGVGNNRAALSVSVLERRGAADSGKVATVRTELQLPARSRAAVEYGLAKGGGLATGVDLHGGSGRAWYSLRHGAVDAAYPSALRGHANDDASLSVGLLRSVRVEANAYRHTSDPQTSSRWASDDHGWRGALAVGGALRVEGFSRTRSDPSLRSVVERGARARGQARLGPLTLSGSAEHSLIADSLTDAPVPADRYSGRLALSGKRTALSISAEHSTRSLLGMSIAGRSDAFFVEAHLEPRSGTQLDASFERRSSAERIFEDAVAELRVRQRVLFGQEIEVRARKSLLIGAGARREPQVLVSYHVPIALPVGLSQTVAGVDVILREAGTGRGIGGVVFRVGDRTGITDAEGRASFAALTPGSYTLDGDVAALGLVLTSGRSLPLQVRAEGGARREVTLTVARQARFAARVRIVADSSPDASLSRASMPASSQLLVMLTNGTDTLRRFVDADERARFTGLRPGRWTMLADRSTVPRHHRVLGDSVTVDLVAGASREADLRIVPTARPVIIVAEQELREGVQARPLVPAGSGVPAPVARATVARESVPRVAPRAPVERSRAGDARPPHYYVVGTAERTLADVAHWVYGDTAFWPRLWAANRAVPGVPNHLEEGSLLLVPPAGPLTPEEMLLLRRAGADSVHAVGPRGR